MNIIKLKDVIMPAEMVQAELFNKYLKGKYAYWIQMRYIVPFEFMRHGEYVDCESDISKLANIPCVDFYENGIINYVDGSETDRVNSIMEYRLKNKYAPDEHITIDELKNFRTWLATGLLAFDLDKFGNPSHTQFSETEEHILDYYSHNMYNSTIKILSEFGGSNVSYNELTKSTCGCASTNISSLYNSELHVCDPISIYRGNIKNKMVELFSNIEFWCRFSPEFILEFKKYIDNIIRCNFPLYVDTFVEKIADCGCTTDSNKQEKLVEILSRLSTSLDYIYRNDINGHKNYIYDALHDWSSQLYENMQW